MSRITHDITKINGRKVFSKCDTIITFRTQQLLDLWINEMQGQISDGMWENSRGTKWLWTNVWYQIGNETRVETRYSYGPGGRRKRNYPLTKDLWDVVGTRILDENGFANKKEAYAAWREIYNAIRNVGSFRPETIEILASANKTVEIQRKETVASLVKEWKDAGFEIKEVKYSWSDSVHRELECLYLDDDIAKTWPVHAEIRVSEDGKTGKWKLQVKEGHAFLIPAGKLVEGWKKIKSFYQDWKNFVNS